VKFLADDDRLGIVITPAEGRHMYRFQLVIDGHVVGDAEPCIVGSAMKGLGSLKAPGDPRLSLALSDPAALVRLVTAIGERDVESGDEPDDADVDLHDSTVLSLAESLDSWLLLGFAYDGRVVFLASQYREGGARGEVITAVIEPLAYGSLLEASRAYWAGLEAATRSGRPPRPDAPSAPGEPAAYVAGTVMSTRRARRWNRRERERAARQLMSRAFIEIRALAYGTLGKEGPAGALERIALLAGACHNLPGVIGRRPPAPGEADPFVGPWRNPREHDWMARVLKSASLDTSWLDAAPRTPPVVAPAERPRLARGGIRLPRSLREYTSADTATLRALVSDALEASPPPQARQAYLRSLLAHAAPEGRHLLRAIRPGERPALASGGLTEFRCLMRMNDQAVIVFRPRLRSEALTVIPRRLWPARQLWLTASTPRRHERDDYLWTRHHRTAQPDCPLCQSPPAG